VTGMRGPAPAARPPIMAPSVVLLLLAVLLAGCSDGGGDGGPGPSGEPSSSTTGPPLTPAPPPTPPDAPLVFDLLPDFAFEGCQALSIVSDQPIDKVQALLPDGFTAAASPSAPALGVLAMDLYVCGNLTTPNVRIANMSFGMVYTHIQPPTERVAGVPAADVHEYAFRLLAGQDVLSALWPAAGYDTYDGAVAFTIGPVGDLPIDLGARSGNGSVGEYFMLATGPGPAGAPAESTFARFTALGDGSVLVWTGTYRATALAGQGSFQVAGDDPVAGFEAANNIPGAARLMESAEAVDQDLRRHF
jgi:hypothetical protein